MIIFRKTIKIIVILFCICFSITGCTKNRGNKEIKGRFVFEGKRDNDYKYKIYLLSKGRIKKISDKGINPKWASDGNKFGFVTGGKKFIICNRVGEVLKELKLKYKVFISFDWFKDNKTIIYSAEETLNLNTKNEKYNRYLIKVNTETGDQEVLKAFLDTEITFHISNIEISPDNKKIIFNISEASGGLHLMDIDGKNLKRLYRGTYSLSWYPDSKHILFGTNSDKNYKKINNKFGRMYKINIETEELEIVEETSKQFYKHERLSKDGKYLYYSKPAEKGGSQIAICPINKPRTKQNETLVTYPHFINTGVGHSRDEFADWHQEN